MLLNKIDIHRCKGEDFEQLRPLFKEVYSANPLMQNRSYFDWQFKNTPFDPKDEYNFWILRQEATIKGFLGFFPLEFCYEENIHKGCLSLNWASLGEGHYGLELMSRLMEDYENRFFLGLSQEAAAIFKAYGLPVIDELPRWVGIVDASKCETIFQIQDANERKQLFDSQACLKALSVQWQFEHPLHFEEKDEFFFKGYPQVKGFIRRTGAYLNWRYVDIPGHNYNILRGTEGEFAVYRIEEITGLGISVMRILEWNFAKKRSEAAMAHLCKEAQEQQVILIDFFTTASSLGVEFERLGFKNEKVFQINRIAYLFRPLFLKEGIPQAFDICSRVYPNSFACDEWYVTKGDSDMDRIKL